MGTPEKKIPKWHTQKMVVPTLVGFPGWEGLSSENPVQFNWKFPLYSFLWVPVHTLGFSHMLCVRGRQCNLIVTLIAHPVISIFKKLYRYIILCSGLSGHTWDGLQWWKIPGAIVSPPLKWFRGVTQGYPLSPTIFNVVVDTIRGQTDKTRD